MKQFYFKNSKSFTKIVKIEYNDLVKISKSKDFSVLSNDINDAYGVDGLGAIIIQNVPDHFNKKFKLLNQTKELVSLPKQDLDKLEKPDINYGIGWSFGKEKFKGKPDFLKGSFYAQLPIYNDLVNKKESPTPNVWPSKLPNLQPALYEVGNQIREVSLMLYDCIDAHINKLLPGYNLTFKDIVKQSNHNVGRLLHYFERGNNKISKDDNWCGWHNDHGALTGLVSALFFNKKGQLVNDSIKLEKSGLWIQSRKGEYFKVSYGKNDIAYQIGETYQILSGGRLYATPHAVIIDEDCPSDVHRSTFALFMEPEMNFKLNIPKGSDLKDITTADIYPVPKIQDRFNRDGMSFKEFNDKTIEAFHKYL